MDYAKPEIAYHHSLFKNMLLLGLSIWSVIIPALFLYQNQHLSTTKQSLEFGQVTLFIGAIYSLLGLIHRKSESGRFYESTESTKGLPFVIGAYMLAYFVFSFFVGFMYTENHAGFLDNFKQLALLTLFVCGSFLVGDLFIEKLMDKPPVLDRFFVSTSTGFGAISLAVFFAGITGALYITPARVIFTVLALVGLYKVGAILFSAYKNDANCVKFLFATPGVIGTVLGLMIGISLTAALLPPWNYDSMLYHLAVPEHFIQTHRIYYIRDFLPANYPMNGEMLFLLGMLLKNDVLAQLISFIIGCWLILGVYVFAARFRSKRAGVYSVALLCSIPAFMQQLSINNNDVILALFTLAGTYALCSWLDTRETKWLYLSGFLFGCAIGTKYSGLFLVLPLLVILFIRIASSNMNARGIEFRGTPLDLKTVLSFTAFSLLGIAPWLGKNFVFTGNPIYPIFAGLIGGKDWLPSATTLFVETVKNANSLINSPIGYFAIPWYLTFREPPETTIGLSFLALFPILAIYIIALALKKNEVGIAHTSKIAIFVPSFIGACYLCLWVVKLAHVARFALPGIVLLILAIAVSVDAFLEESSERGPETKRALIFANIYRFVVAAVLLIGIIFSLYLVSVSRSDAIRIAPSASLSRIFTSSSGLYKISAYINKNISSNKKIAMLIDNRSYYLKHRNLLMLSPLNNGRINQVNIKSPEELLSIFKREKVDYVFATDEVRRYTYTLPKNSPYRIYYPLVSNCDALIAKGALVPVYSNGDFCLYRIASGNSRGDH